MTVKFIGNTFDTKKPLQAFLCNELQEGQPIVYQFYNNPLVHVGLLEQITNHALLVCGIDDDGNPLTTNKGYIPIQEILTGDVRVTTALGVIEWCQ